MSSSATDSSTPKPELVQLPIHKGVDDELVVDKLRFEACRREIEGIDGGVTLRVFWTEGDQPELLRFDAFRKSPHYHAPGEETAENKIETSPDVDPKAWVIDRVANHLPALIEQAGYGSLVEALSDEARSGLEPRLVSLFEGLAEPSETSYFEIKASVLAKARAS